MKAAIVTDTLDRADGSLYYEVRGDGPPVVLHAAPMDATSFEPLADELAARFRVVTSDPRGIHRSTVHEAHADITPDQRADDLAGLLDHLALGPAVLLGSSGGAVSALALLQARPDLVSTVIVHEPPLAVLLDDCDEIARRTDEMIETYRRGDRLGYWGAFLALAGIEIPPAAVAQMFGDPLDERTARDEHLAAVHMDRPTTFWCPDLDRLRGSTVPLVVGIGEASAGQLCDRTARALAAAVGLEPVIFPGDHTGFADVPHEFARLLVEVIASSPATSGHRSSP